MMRGRELVAIDLIAGKVSWTTELRSCQRAAWVDDVLVVAANRELRGYRRAHRQAAVDAHDRRAHARPADQRRPRLRPRPGRRGGHARQPPRRGRRLPRRRGVERAPSRARTTATSSRGATASCCVRCATTSGGARGELLVFDAFDGRRRHTLPVPLQVDAHTGGRRRPVVRRRHDRRSQQARPDGLRPRRGARALDARRSKASTMVGALVRDGPLPARPAAGRHAHDALAQGRHAAARDARLRRGGRQRAAVPELPAARGRQARHVHPVGPATVAERRLLRPRARASSSGSRRTSRASRCSKASLVETGDLLIAMIAYRKDDAQRILLRLIDRESGKLVQVIEPDALSKDNWVPEPARGLRNVGHLRQVGREHTARQGALERPASRSRSRTRLRSRRARLPSPSPVSAPIRHDPTTTHGPGNHSPATRSARSGIWEAPTASSGERATCPSPFPACPPPVPAARARRPCTPRLPCYVTGHQQRTGRVKTRRPARGAGLLPRRPRASSR